MSARAEKASGACNLYFSDYFSISEKVLEDYGAFNISIVSDLPLFIDPFLLFHSDKPEYQELHDDIIKYLVFLRDRAGPTLTRGALKNWYHFKEVKQNWLGFTFMGNGGSGLGLKFAVTLNRALSSIIKGFGSEGITAGSHLEKLALIEPGVGRDCISDFTTNLIKHYLLEYTQEFARKYLDKAKCDTFSVTRACFNYDSKAWETKKYYLPKLDNDFVLLTPSDLLTKDDTWINHGDMMSRILKLPDAIDDESIRSQINQFFYDRLFNDPKRKPTKDEKNKATSDAIIKFPILIDVYIKDQEENGDLAITSSYDKRQEVRNLLVDQIRKTIPDIRQKSNFMDLPISSYEESLIRANAFKDYVENNDGYKLINKGGKPFSNESEVQIFFGLIWFGSSFDMNREVNNGRGPVDFKISKGSIDKSLIEFKLASNTGLKRNLENQVKIYEKANGIHNSVKVIVCYTEEDQKKANGVLYDLNLTGDESIVLIDARSDNKPSASKA